MKTLIVQSYTSKKPNWIHLCQQSVINWSTQNSYTYRFIGDEIFAYNPKWFNDKLQDRLPILSDLARLLYTKEALKEYERVVWFDIDCLIFAPAAMQLTEEAYLFGYERWIQPHKNQWKVYKNVCNAFFQFRPHNTFLDFYIETAKRIILDVHPDHIAPQLIGPKLLTAIHNITRFPVTTMVGSASPWLLSECAQNMTYLYTKMAKSITLAPCAALNLCASLIHDDVLLCKAIEFLKKNGPIHHDTMNKFL